MAATGDFSEPDALVLARFFFGDSVGLEVEFFDRYFVGLEAGISIGDSTGLEEQGDDRWPGAC